MKEGRKRIRELRLDFHRPHHRLRHQLPRWLARSEYVLPPWITPLFGLDFSVGRRNEEEMGLEREASWEFEDLETEVEVVPVCCGRPG